MKAQKIFEMIKKHHPTMAGTEILDIMNEATDEFCRRSNIFKQSYSQNTVSGTRYYTLDNKIYKILDVTLNEVSIPRLIGTIAIDDDELIETSSNDTYDLGAPSTSANERFWYEDLGRLAIVEKVSGAIKRAGKESNYQSISIEGLLRLKTISSPADITTATLSTANILDGVSGNFGRYIADYGIAHGYRAPETMNPQQADYFEMRFEKGLKEAKKFGRSRYINTGSIKPIDF